MESIKSIFEEIASIEDGIFSVAENTVGGLNGEYLPDLNYNLEIKYRGSDIVVNNRTGTTAIGSIICIMPKMEEQRSFQLFTRSHFASLFLRGGRFRFKGDERVKSFMERSNSFSILKKISKDTAFEPTIKGTAGEDKFEMVIEYHLVFENWIQAVEPLVSFCKEFIDAHYSFFQKK